METEKSYSLHYYSIPSNIHVHQLSCGDFPEKHRQLSELFNAVLCTTIVHSHKHTEWSFNE